MEQRCNYVFLGLSITSTWGNGHATTYRGLTKELTRRGHSVTFLERDVPWYAANREFTEWPYCKVILYSSLQELKDRYAQLIREADAVVVGSYVPDGLSVGRWIVSIAKSIAVFYDIDTPVTLAALRAGKCEYLSRDLVHQYHLYLSFTGGPTLDVIERQFGAQCARPLYCSVDPSCYYPEPVSSRWDLGYLGTYAADRQPALENLLIRVAQNNSEMRFCVAGPQYPEKIGWPSNVDRICHLPAPQHRSFYSSQRMTLNITRRDMVLAGYSPSVRLFEAAACGVPIITDLWPGLESFFRPGSEILPVSTPVEVASYLQMPSDQRHEIAEKARIRALREHTSAVRALEFDRHIAASLDRFGCSNKRTAVLVKSASAALI